MSTTLSDLLPPDQKPLTVQMHETVLEAIERLRAHDFNQLPVVDEGGRCRGEVVTYDTILQAVLSFDAKPSELRVKDAIKRMAVYDADEDLLTTLDAIQRYDFALIVNTDKILTGIVTTADTTAYFHKYAGDLMMIEGVEESIKESIEILYGGLDKAELAEAIETVTDRASDTRKKLPAAIRAYLAKAGIKPPEEDNAEAIAAAESKLKLPAAGKPFDRLSFDEYTEILLRHQNLPAVGDTDSAKAMRKLLNSVRDSRNKLAHFRGDMSFCEREDIKFAAQWLERHRPHRETADLNQGDVEEPQGSQPEADDVIMTNPPFEGPVSQDTTPKGKYAELAQFLAEEEKTRRVLTLNFEEIEAKLGWRLPESAYNYRAWWANDLTKPQAAAWIDEGWRTVEVDMAERRVTFLKTRDRAIKFIDFFTVLLRRLEDDEMFPLTEVTPKGANWQVLAFLHWKRNTQSASIFATFTRDRQLRVELYLDSGNDDENKRRFDDLYARKEFFEALAGEPLQWERRDGRRACRIAIYAKAQIETAVGSPQILEWAAQSAIALNRAFGPEFPLKK